MKLDKTKFRFKIDDTIIYKDKLGKIAGYYFSTAFNNFDSSYGYTIEIEGGVHYGQGFTYDEEGKEIRSEKLATYIHERNASFIFQPEFLNAKPGDKVRVKKRIGSGDSYAYYFSTEMNNLQGSIFTIRSIILDNKSNYKYPSSFRIMVEEKKGYNWASSMLELIPEKEESKEEPEKPTLSLKGCIKAVKKLVLGDESEINSNIKIKKAKPNLTFNI